MAVINRCARWANRPRATARSAPWLLSPIAGWGALGAAMFLAGCAISPEGAEHEQARLDAAGAPYAAPFAERDLPDLPPDPAWNQVLQRAFLANGDVEAAFFRWQAAMERVSAAGAWPNSNLTVGYSYMASGGDMRAFDRSTVSLEFDPSMNLVLPFKARQAARVALEEAKVAGDEFRVARFDLQRKVLFAWADYKSQAALLELKREDAALRRLLADAAAARAAVTGDAAGLVNARASAEQAENDRLDAEGEFRRTRSLINGLLGRAGDAPLGVPVEPEVMPELADDSAALGAAVESFPEVAVAVDALRGREEALELARLKWLPDISPTFMFTGSVSQAVGAMVTLPTTVVEIQSMVREARSGVREAEAVLRQKRSDRMAEYVSLLIMARDAQRRGAFARGTLAPAAERIVQLRERAYASGRGELMDVVESNRMAIEVRAVQVEAAREYEKAMVEIACCLGVGLDQIGTPVDQAADHMTMEGHKESTP